MDVNCDRRTGRGVETRWERRGSRQRRPGGSAVLCLAEGRGEAPARDIQKGPCGGVRGCVWVRLLEEEQLAVMCSRRSHDGAGGRDSPLIIAAPVASLLAQKLSGSWAGAARSAATRAGATMARPGRLPVFANMFHCGIFARLCDREPEPLRAAHWWCNLPGLRSGALLTCLGRILPDMGCQSELF